VVRFCVYHSTRLSQQPRIHRALAAADDAGQHPDRVAWQLWMAVRGPDDAVASIIVFAAVPLAVPYRAHSALWLGT